MTDVVDIMFYLNFLIYILINVRYTYKMYKCEDRDTKVGLASLPVPLFILDVFVNYKIFEYIVGFDGVDGYGTGLAIIGGQLMIFFLIINLYSF